MGCVISCGIKLVLQILNSILFIAFLAVGIFGILLKTSKSVVESIINQLLAGRHVDEDEATRLAEFIIENADAVSLVLIIVGFALAALCLIGCLASCCGWNILLKIYAAILIVIVIVQIIVVAYVFSDPNRTSKFIVKAMTESLKFYNEKDEKGDISTAVWDLTMRFDNNNPCCGMEGYTDFESKNNMPEACCKQSSCTVEQAKTDKIGGCKGRIVEFTNKNMQIIMFVWIVGIFLQVVLIVLVLLAICL